MNNINSSKMINYIIKTDELLERNISNKANIIEIINKIFSKPLNPYSKKVLQNIISKILNKSKINEEEKTIIIEILNKLKSDKLSLINSYLIMYITDKIYLYSKDNKKNKLIEQIKSNFQEFNNYIQLYEVTRNINSVVNIGSLNKSVIINQKRSNLPVQQSTQNNPILNTKPIYNKNGVEIKVGNKVTVNNKNKGEIISFFKNSNQNKIIIRKKNSTENISTKPELVKKIQVNQPVSTATIGRNAETGFSENNNTLIYGS